MALPVRAFWVTVCLSLSLTGCGGEKLGKLQRAEPVGTPFQKALAKEYRAFATAEDSKGESFDTQYFADKGLRAAYGQETAPEKLSKWDVKEDSKPALIQARNDLLDVFHSGVPEQYPDKSARAQVLFDCWMMQEEQDIAPYEAYCREDFLVLLDELVGYQQTILTKKDYHRINSTVACNGKPCTLTDTNIAPSQENTASASATASTQGQEGLSKDSSTAQSSVTSTGWEKFSQTSGQPGATGSKADKIVYFNFDSASLTNLAETALKGTIPSITTLPSYEVMVNGHTDRAGTEAYNLKLSKRRAETVKKRLIQGGVKPAYITIFAFGESSPAEETADGIRNPANRRVEISVKTR